MPYRTTSHGIELRVRVVPRAAREGVGALYRDAKGESYLVVKVGVPPEGGRANAAMLRVLATALGLGVSSLELISGAGSRLKRVLIDADHDSVATRLASLLDGRA